MSEDRARYEAGDLERRRLETQFEADRPDLQEALRNWGDWSYGGLEDLGYPHRDPSLAQGGGEGARTFDPDRAAGVEFVLSAMRVASLHTARCALMLRTEYVLADRPEIERARRWKMARSTWQRKVREAEFCFWQLWRGLPDSGG